MPTWHLSKLMAILTVAILAIPLAVAPPTAGDGDDQYDVLEKADLKYPHLGSSLNQLVARVETGEAPAEEAAKDAPIHL